jgi:hypothetical protein
LDWHFIYTEQPNEKHLIEKDKTRGVRPDFIKNSIALIHDASISKKVNPIGLLRQKKRKAILEVSCPRREVNYLQVNLRRMGEIFFYDVLPNFKLVNYLPCNLEVRIIDKNSQEIRSTLLKGCSQDIFKFTLSQGKMLIHLKVLNCERIFELDKIMQTSPQFFKKQLKNQNDQNIKIPLRIFFDKKTWTFYFFPKFNILNETGLEMTFSSGKKLKNLMKCESNHSNSVFFIADKRHQIVSGTLVKKLNSKYDLKILGAETSKLAFPRKLVDNMYSKIDGGSGLDSFSFEVLIKPQLITLYDNCPFSIKTIVISPKYVVSNSTKFSLYLAQGSQKKLLEMKPGERVPVIWRVKTLKRVAFKPNIFSSRTQ